MKSFCPKFFLLAVMMWASSYSFALDLNGVAGGGNYRVSTKSFAEMRFDTVYKQEFDFSCGSAALASLLTFHYGDVVSEKNVFAEMYEHGDQEKIKDQGFSMLDMKNYLERHGYGSDGFKFNLDKLREFNSPAITIIDLNGYLHFVIIKGVTEQKVLVGDPAVGVKIIPRDEFEKMWGERILFMIRDNGGIQTEESHNQREWHARLAPLQNAVDRASLGEDYVLMRGQVVGAPLDF